MLNSNEAIKVADFRKLANQSVLNGALVIEKWLHNLVNTRKTFVVLQSVSQQFRTAKKQQSRYQEEGYLF